MRTTVVLKDDLVKKAKRLSGQPTLSGLLNECLADWIARHDKREYVLRLGPAISYLDPLETSALVVPA